VLAIEAFLSAAELRAGLLGRRSEAVATSRRAHGGRGRIPGTLFGRGELGQCAAGRNAHGQRGGVDQHLPQQRVAQLNLVTVYRDQVEALGGYEVLKAQAQGFQQIRQCGQSRWVPDGENVERITRAFRQLAEHLLPDLLNLASDRHPRACLRGGRERIPAR
jgi:hypothetical protein